MIIRSLEDISTQIKDSILASGCGLTDFNPTSVAYTLIRSMAGAIQLSESKLARDLESVNFLTASDLDLDNYAGLFGIARKKGDKSAGFALFLSEVNLSLPENTILFGPRSGQQYLTTTNVDLAKSVEVAIPIVAANTGSEYTLPAGTKLVSENPSLISVVVGYERKYDGSFCGDLGIGIARENDISLRSRLFDLVRAGGNLTPSVLRSIILNDDRIVNCRVKTVAPGVIEVLVLPKSNPSDSTLLKSIQSTVESFTVGCWCSVRLGSPRPLSIEIELADKQSLDYLGRDLFENFISEQIVSSVTEGIFKIDDFLSALQSLIPEVKLTHPTQDLVWQTEDFPYLQDLYVKSKV